MIKLTPRRAAAAGKYHAPLPPTKVDQRAAAADQISSAWGSSENINTTPRVVIDFGVNIARPRHFENIVTCKLNVEC